MVVADYSENADYGEDIIGIPDSPKEGFDPFDMSFENMPDLNDVAEIIFSELNEQELADIDKFGRYLEEEFEDL